MRELVGGKNTIGRTAAVLKKPHKATFNLLTFLTPFKHIISEEVFVHSFVQCFFYCPEHCTCYGVPWFIQAFYAMKLPCFREMRERATLCFFSFFHTVVLMITITVIPRLTKIIRSGITFVSRNVISRRFL